MVSLVLYSDQVIPENDKVDARLLDLMSGRGRRIGYVSSGPEPDRSFYRERQAYYARLDLHLPVFFDMAEPPEPADWAPCWTVMRSTCQAATPEHSCIF